MHPHLTIATKAARAAAKIMLDGLARLDQVKISEKGRNNFVTDIDHKCDQTLISIIQQHYPNHNILSEEQGFIPGKKHSEYKWIIDPLDGTTNFIHGYPFFCISMACEYAGKTQVGLIYNPISDELFIAENGRGAHVNQQRMRVSPCKTIDSALVGIGCRHTENSESYTKIQTLTANLLPQCVAIRNGGSAALALAYIACGRLDAYIASDLHPWDIAAGELMIQEAGGISTRLRSTHTNDETYDVIASAPPLHKALTQTFNQS